MANQKISELDDEAVPTSDDLIALVNDLAGSPVTKRATLANLAAALASMAGMTTALDGRHPRMYVHDGSAYQLAGGRIFVGPEDPTADGFTPDVGDIWMETT